MLGCCVDECDLVGGWMWVVGVYVCLDCVGCVECEWVGWFDDYVGKVDDVGCVGGEWWGWG